MGRYDWWVLDNINMLVTMKKDKNNNTNECPTITDDIPFVGIRDQFGRYDLIQLKLNQNDVKRLKLSQDYLVVNTTWAGIYQLVNILYPDGKIQMKLKSNISLKVVSTLLDDYRPQFYLLLWKDVKQMANEAVIRNIVDDELLQLDY
jgi:hypothetical protein